MDTRPTRDRARLARLWADHRAAPYPDGFRGADLAGVELVLADADVAALVERERKAGPDGDGIAIGGGTSPGRPRPCR